MSTRDDFDLVIGRLDRLLSEFLLLTKALVDEADRQTLIVLLGLDAFGSVVK